MRYAVTVILAVFLFCVKISAQTISISEARSDANHDFIPDRLNDTVTVSGVVFTPNYQTIRTSYFITDGTAGINLYKTNLLAIPLQFGDSIVVRGQIKQLNGLTQIIPFADSTISIISSNAHTPKPIEIKPGDFYKLAESYEGSLVKVLRLKKGTGSIWPLSGNATLNMLNETDSIVVRIDSDTDIEGRLEPLWPKDVVGVLYQSASSTAYNDGYELMPRYYSTDFLPATPVSVHESTNLPQNISLEQNYPNPFNPSTTIEYALPEKSKVKIEIFNSIGQLKENLFTGEQEQGNHSIKWTTDLPSGIYFYRIEIVSDNDHRNSFSETRKMILIK